MKLSALSLHVSLGLPLLAATAGSASAQCLNGSCPPENVLHTSDPFMDEIIGVVPFRQMTLSIGQFDPNFYAEQHDVPPTAISLLGVSLEFYGEINPLIQLDSGSSPSCSVDWSYDVDSIIYTNPDIDNRGTLVIVSESGTAALPASNGSPPPWDVTIVPPVQTDSFCFVDTEDLGAWTGTGQVDFTTDGYSFSSTQGCAGALSSFTNQGILRVTATYHYCVADEPPPPVDPGTPVCFGDGTANGGIACPCANNATDASGGGCANLSPMPAGQGARLRGTGTNSIGADDLVLTVDFVTNQPGLFFQGDNTIAGGNGNGFGDGLRCCGTGVVRLELGDPAGPNGTHTTSTTLNIIGTSPPGTTTPGVKRCYQYWYRNPGRSPCGANFNLSNAYSVTWTP